MVLLYRAIDRSGALVDVRLSEKRDDGGSQGILSIGQAGSVLTSRAVSRRAVTTKLPTRDPD